MTNVVEAEYAFYSIEKLYDMWDTQRIRAYNLGDPHLDRWETEKIAIENEIYKRQEKGLDSIGDLW